jgi:hypothetical protein
MPCHALLLARPYTNTRLKNTLWAFPECQNNQGTARTLTWQTINLGLNLKIRPRQVPGYNDVAMRSASKR